MIAVLVRFFHLMSLNRATMKRFLEGNWRQIKSQLRSKYNQLSEKDLSYAEGQEEELLGRLQIKLDLAKDELITEFKNLITK